MEERMIQGMMGAAKAHYDGIVAFSQTDFTADLTQITVPVLVMHGDDDQVVPYADSGPLTATGKGPLMIVDRYLPDKEVTIHDDGRDGFCCGMGNTGMRVGASETAGLSRLAIGENTLLAASRGADVTGNELGRPDRCP